MDTPSSGRALVAVADIAEMANAKSRATVSNWRKRHADFPAPVDDNPARPLFDRAEVVTWLKGRGYEVTEDHGAGLWATLNAVRNDLDPTLMPELVLTLATLKKLSSEVNVALPPWFGFRPSEGFADLQRLLDQLGDLDARFESLFSISRGLLSIPSAIVEAAYAAVGDIADEHLGSATDFVLARAAKSAGRKGEGFESGFAESRTSQLLASLAAGHSGSIYDPACGVAEALIKTLDGGFEATHIQGDEIHPLSSTIARQRLYLRGYDATITTVDVLATDAHPDASADVIIAEPPFGVRLPESFVLSDPRWRYGLPPKSSSEGAWLQHTIAHLADGGRGYVLTTAGALFRRDPVRQELVRAGCVEAIVALPPRLLPHTSVTLVLWVLRPAQTADQTIAFIDASADLDSETLVPGWLQALHTDDVIDVPHQRVEIDEILAADADLSPARWIGGVERSPQDARADYDKAWAVVQQRLDAVSAAGADLVKIDPVLTSRTLSLRALMDQGIVKVSTGRGRERDVPDEFADRVIKPITISNGGADHLEDAELHDMLEPPRWWNTVPENLRHQLTEPGEVLLTNRFRIHAVCDTKGGHYPTADVYRLRVTNPAQLDPRFLAAALRGSWNSRFLVGSTSMLYANPHLLEIPMIAPEHQALVVQASRTAALLDRQAAELHTEAAALRQALLDTIRYTGGGQ